MQARRVTIEKEILINGGVRAEALNLSRTGMFVLCQQGFEEGTTIALSVPLAGATYHFHGRVERLEEGLGFAVRFVDLNRETAEFLGRYVDRRAELRWEDH